MTRRVLLILLSLLVLALASGCTRLPRFHLPFFGQLDEEALPDPIRIGLATDAPPLSWREDGRMHGLDPHLAGGMCAMSPCRATNSWQRSETIRWMWQWRH